MAIASLEPVVGNTAGSRPPSLRRHGRRRPLPLLLQYVAAFALVGIFVFPFLVMLTTAFKPEAEIFTTPPRLFPSTFTLDNFVGAFEAMPVARYFFNTVFVTSLTVLGSLVACPLVAYSLAKVNWIGQKPLMVAVLATMMLPPQVTMIPLYMLWGEVGAHNTYLPLIAPAWMGTPFLIFMIRQFLMSIPDELIEAARLDGANELRIYWNVVLPLALPALATAGVFQFVWTWTDFLNPLIYLDDAEKYTISIGLYNFFGEQTVAWGPLMAACVLFTIPALLIFLLGQRYFIGGATAGALK